MVLHAILILSSACTIFGLSCEVGFKLVHWNCVREAEDQLVSGLSGRSRFQRNKRKKRKSKRSRLKGRRSALY